jgi:hypothetical protein
MGKEVEPNKKATKIHGLFKYSLYGLHRVIYSTISIFRTRVGLPSARALHTIQDRSFTPAAHHISLVMNKVFGSVVLALCTRI